jgi:hypothetical protein
MTSELAACTAFAEHPECAYLEVVAGFTLLTPVWWVCGWGKKADRGLLPVFREPYPREGAAAIPVERGTSQT